jgi:hypothetical protein
MDNGLNYTEKGKGMSGWQRLGVVVSVVIAVLTVSMKYDSFPTQKQASMEHGGDIRFFMTCDQYFRDKEAGRSTTVNECSSYRRYEVTESLSKALKAYKNKLDTLPDRQVKFVAYYFTWWSGISLTLYLIALSVKWVYRGFRPKRV